MPAALSLFLPYFIGLGLLVLALVQPGLLRTPGDGSRSALLLALALLLGIMVNYDLVLIVGSLNTTLAMGTLGAFAGYTAAGPSLAGRLRELSFRGWSFIALAGFLFILIGVPILFTPITEWDPRSIWFFHAKMIYYAGGLTNETGFAASAVQFSHVGYPKLIPVLAAQSAQISGLWNEYLPKFSLLVLLFPAVLIAITHMDRRAWISNALLIALLFLAQNIKFWSGYLDGYLALYAALACLSLGRWFAEGEDVDGLVAAGCLAVATSLKHEGILIAATTIAVAAGFRAATSGAAAIKNLFVWRGWLIAGIGFSGTVLWTYKKLLWQLPQSAEVAMPNISRIIERLSSSDALCLIVQHLLAKSHILMAAGCVLISFFITKGFHKRVNRIIWAPALIGALYCAEMFVIYLNTPNDLKWHLENSADRTSLPIILCLLLSPVLAIRSLEHSDQT